MGKDTLHMIKGGEVPMIGEIEAVSHSFKRAEFFLRKQKLFSFLRGKLI